MALRARAVAAYEGGATGSVAPRPKGGGWRCPIDLTVLNAVVREPPDGFCTESCRAYNRRVRRAQQTNPTSLRRAIRRAGYVLKKHPRPSEHDRPDVRTKRPAFRAWVSTIDPKRLVTLDEAGVNIAMGRSHAWVPRGEE